MTEKMPGLPDPTPIEAPEASEPQVSTLSNGVRVISQDLGGPVTSLALFVGAGSRHENPMTAGSTFMIERLAYKGSAQRSKFRLTRDMERTGAMYSAAAARESIAYAAEGMRQSVPDIVPIVLECATAPLAPTGQYGELEWDAAMDEIKTHAGNVKEDLKNISKDPNTVVTEAVHNVAFHGNTLGKFIFVPLRKAMFSCDCSCLEITRNISQRQSDIERDAEYSVGLFKSPCDFAGLDFLTLASSDLVTSRRLKSF